MFCIYYLYWETGSGIFPTKICVYGLQRQITKFISNSKIAIYLFRNLITRNSVFPRHLLIFRCFYITLIVWHNHLPQKCLSLSLTIQHTDTRLVEMNISVIFHEFLHFSYSNRFSKNITHTYAMYRSALSSHSISIIFRFIV